jgi:hypothetical protein
MLEQERSHESSKISDVPDLDCHRGLALPDSVVVRRAIKRERILSRVEEVSMRGIA